MAKSERVLTYGSKPKVPITLECFPCRLDRIAIVLDSCEHHIAVAPQIVASELELPTIHSNAGKH
eukprot:12917616-Prorocentrum_lima.AAC.1